MKKAMVLCSCVLLLTACAALRNNVGNDARNTVTGSAITGSIITASAVSGGVVSTAAVSGAAMEEKKEREKTEIKREVKQKVSIVTDKTGKKRKLKLGDVNLQDTGVDFGLFTSWPAGIYSQVSNGHYYYLRTDGQHNYTIYRDKGQEIGQFTFDIDADASYRQLEYFVKYGTEYYGLIECIHEEKYEEEATIKYYLTRIDLEKGKAEPILELSDRTTGSLYLYQRNIYFEDLSTIDEKYWEWDPGMGEDDSYGDFVKIDMEKGFSETTLPITYDMGQQLPFLFFADGKAYYGRQKGKKVTLYSYDLESSQEEKILCYEREKKYNKYDERGGNIWLEMDEDYIYCQDYIIPRDGGKMIPLFRQAESIMNDPKEDIRYTYNKKYIFYTDKKHRLHRFSKKTKEDVIISDIEAMDIKCTEDCVYLQEYTDCVLFSGGLEDDKWSSGDKPYSGNLYCMDMDGKHVEKIESKVLPYLD